MTRVKGAWRGCGGRAVSETVGQFHDWALRLVECEGAEVSGVKHALGALPDGRRLDVFAGRRDGRVYLRVRESQGGRKRFYRVE